LTASTAAATLFPPFFFSSRSLQQDQIAGIRNRKLIDQSAARQLRLQCGQKSSPDRMLFTIRATQILLETVVSACLPSENERAKFPQATGRITAGDRGSRDQSGCSGGADARKASA